MPPDVLANHYAVDSCVCVALRITFRVLSNRIRRSSRGAPGVTLAVAWLLAPNRLAVAPTLLWLVPVLRWAPWTARG
jgi:hypothetical protein